MTKLMVSVHWDVHRDGMGKFVIKYAALDVKMVHVINRVGFVLVDANRIGQGIIATVSIGNNKSFAIILLTS